MGAHETKSWLSENRDKYENKNLFCQNNYLRLLIQELHLMLFHLHKMGTPLLFWEHLPAFALFLPQLS